jgi:hypothetical protein
MSVARFRWLFAVAGLVLGFAAPLDAQDPLGQLERDTCYDAYVGGYDRANPDDDWFYDYYDQDRDPRDRFADFDAQSDAFDWEEEGLFA